MRVRSIFTLIVMLVTGIGLVPAVPESAARALHFIVLNDGTTLSGTLVPGESKRKIALFTAEGATIHIPVSIIKTIDGWLYSGGDLTPGLPEIPPPRDSAGYSKSRRQEIPPEPEYAIKAHSSPSVLIKAGSSIEELLAALKNPSDEMRSAAARELGRHGQWTTEVVSALEALLADTTGQWIIPPLFIDKKAADSAELPAPGWEAARALAVLGSQGYSKLASLTGSTQGIVREHAAWGLGIIGNRSAVPVIIRLLDDHDQKIRLAVIASLAGMNDPASIKPLVKALADPAVPVRASAASALGTLMAHQAVQALITVVSDSAPEARLAAVIASGKIKDQQSVPALIMALKDQDGSIRKAAAIALGELRDPRAIAPLRTALEESSDSIKPVIRMALKQHTEVPLLIGALDDSDSFTSRNAEYLLWLISGKKFGHDKKTWADWFVSSNGAGDKNFFSAPASTDTPFTSR